MLGCREIGTEGSCSGFISPCGFSLVNGLGRRCSRIGSYRLPKLSGIICQCNNFYSPITTWYPFSSWAIDKNSPIPYYSPSNSHQVSSNSTPWQTPTPQCPKSSDHSPQPSHSRTGTGDLLTSSMNHHSSWRGRGRSSRLDGGIAFCGPGCEGPRFGKIGLWERWTGMWEGGSLRLLIFSLDYFKDYKVWGIDEVIIDWSKFTYVKLKILHKFVKFISLLLILKLNTLINSLKIKKYLTFSQNCWFLGGPSILKLSSLTLAILDCISGIDQ